jgi:hypothetical protein
VADGVDIATEVLTALRQAAAEVGAELPELRVQTASGAAS